MGTREPSEEIVASSCAPPATLPAMPCDSSAEVRAGPGYADEAGEHADRLDAAVRWQAVAVADVIGVGHDMRSLHHAGAAQFFGRRACQVIDHLFLLGLRRAGADAQHGDLRIHRAHARDKTSLSTR